MPSVALALRAAYGRSGGMCVPRFSRVQQRTRLSLKAELRRLSLAGLSADDDYAQLVQN